MLNQRLRCWPTLNQHLVSQLFPDPHGNTTVCVSKQNPHKRIGELFPHRSRSSIYRVYMIWELALNAVMCMKCIVLLSWLITVDME